MGTKSTYYPLVSNGASVATLQNIKIVRLTLYYLDVMIIII